MNPYSLVLAATIAANLALLAYATVRLRQRTPRLALIGFLASFAVAHAASLAFEEGSADPAILGIGFAALVFGYACLALFAVLFLRGEALRRRYPVIAAVLLPGPARAGRGRDGDLEVGAPLDERLDERALAGTGRPRDDEELRLRRQCLKRSTSSCRWRSESPAIVFDGLMRHWLRKRAALTRPNFGTAISMSNTFAVPT